MRFLNIERGSELYHLNADYSLRTTQRGKGIFRGGQNAPFSPQKNPCSVKILGFIFDSCLTWQKHIDNVLNCGRQSLGQLYCCRSLFGSQGIATLYKFWIRPVLEYGSVLYSGAAPTHLNHLDRFQAHVENMCGFTFPSLTDRCKDSILGLTCRLLAGEGRSNLQSFCPKFN